MDFVADGTPVSDVFVMTIVVCFFAQLFPDAKCDVRRLVEIGSGQTYSTQTEYNQINDSGLLIPSYYQVPFHAYKTGNLSWQASAQTDVGIVCLALVLHCLKC